MRVFVPILLMLLAVLIDNAAGAGPAWKKTIPLSDGRTFVTDGAISVDAAATKVTVLPKDSLGETAGKTIERFLALAHPDEVPLADLAPTGDGKYRAPSGLLLNALYVDFLRSALSDGSLRFRMKGDFDPVVILSGGKAVGVVMPMKR